MNRIMLGDCLDILEDLPPHSADSMVTDPPAGIAFMGKDWDKDKGGRDAWIEWMTKVMKEAHRVLKPGSHALVWAIPRTSHWTAMALENSGFIVRDVITHLFGSGFPKSLNISKAIDKAAGAEREVLGTKDGGPNIKGNNFSRDDGTRNIEKITTPSTPEAKQWDGWGTALKPASEHWILVRKPLEKKTVAENVKAYGTGGINIDGCRVAGKPRMTHTDGNYQSKTKNTEVYGEWGLGHKCPEPQGRFPANLVLSGDAPEAEWTRFFYCAKASKAERGEGNTHPTVKPEKLMRYLVRLITPPGGTVLDPFTGSGSTGIAAIKEGFKFLGIEKEKEYFDIAESRLEYAKTEAAGQMKML